MWSEFASLDHGSAVQNAWKQVVAALGELEDTKVLRPSRTHEDPNKWLANTQSWEALLHDCLTLSEKGFSPTAQLLTSICRLHLEGFWAFCVEVKRIAEFLLSDVPEKRPLIPGDDLRHLALLSSPHLVMSKLQTLRLDDIDGGPLGIISVEPSNVAEFRQHGKAFELALEESSAKQIENLIERLSRLAQCVQSIEVSADVSLHNLKAFLERCVDALPKLNARNLTPVQNVQLDTTTDFGPPETGPPTIISNFAGGLSRVALSVLLQPYREAAIAFLVHGGTVFHGLSRFRVLPPALEALSDVLDVESWASMHARPVDRCGPGIDLAPVEDSDLQSYAAALEGYEVWSLPHLYLARAVELIRLSPIDRIHGVQEDKARWDKTILPIIASPSVLRKRIELLLLLAPQVRDLPHVVWERLREMESRLGQLASTEENPCCEHGSEPNEASMIPSMPTEIPAAVVFREINLIALNFGSSVRDERLRKIISELCAMGQV